MFFMIHRAFLERSCYGIKVRQVSEYIIVITGMLGLDAAIVNNQLFHHVCPDHREVFWLQCTLSWHLFCILVTKPWCALICVDATTIRKLQNHKRRSGKIKIHCAIWARSWPDFEQLILELDQISAMSDVVWMTGQLLRIFGLISDISPTANCQCLFFSLCLCEVASRGRRTPVARLDVSSSASDLHLPRS